MRIAISIVNGSIVSLCEIVDTVSISEMQGSCSAAKAVSTANQKRPMSTSLLSKHSKFFQSSDNNGKPKIVGYIRTLSNR